MMMMLFIINVSWSCFVVLLMMFGFKLDPCYEKQNHLVQ
jgi:hypothetical protein